MRSLTVFDRNFFIIAMIFQKLDVHFKQKTLTFCAILQ